MQVEVIDKTDKPVSPFKDIKNLQATLKEYTNKVFNKPDPMIIFAPGRFAHMTTLLKMGFRIRNAETGEIITIPNLAPCE